MVLEQFIIDADIIWDQVGKTFFENPEAKPGRIMRVQVVNAGIIEDLTGYTLNLGWTSVRDPSKFGLDAFDDVDITKGIFEIEYTSGMLTNVGPLNASLQLVPPGEGRPIESNNFKLTVKNSAINAEAIQSETSFKALENALVEVNSWNARIDLVEQEFKGRADALDGAYPVRLTAAEQSVAAVEAQVDLLNRGLGETMASLALLNSTYPAGDTKDHIVAGNIAEVDTLTVTAIPTVAGNITVTLNGVAKTITVDPAVQTTTALVAALIRGTAFTGWTTAGTGTTVTFTSTTAGARTVPIFSGGTTGVTASIVVTVKGENANFHRYFWNGTAWADGGAYQAIEVTNKSIGFEKTKFISTLNLLSSANKYLNKAVNPTTGALEWHATSSAFEIELVVGESYYISQTTSERYRMWLLDANMVPISNFVTLGIGWNNNFTHPTAKYLRGTLVEDSYPSAYICKSEHQSSYFRGQRYIIDGLYVENIDELINDAEQMQSDLEVMGEFFGMYPDLISEAVFIDNSYVNSTNGNIGSNSAYAYPDVYIPIEFGKRYYLFLDGVPKSISQHHAYYNIDKVRIRGGGSDLSFIEAQSESEKFFRFSVSKTAIPRYVELELRESETGVYKTSIIKPEYLPKDTSALEDFFNLVPNFLAGASYPDGKYISSYDGSVGSNADYTYPDVYIPMKQGMRYYAFKNGMSVPISQHNAIYNEVKQFITSRSGSPAYITPISEDEKYFRFSISKTTNPDYAIMEVQESTDGVYQRNGIKDSAINPIFRTNGLSGPTRSIGALTTMTDGLSIELESNAIKKNKTLSFSGRVGTFSGLRLGHGQTDYGGSYIDIDATTIKVYHYATGETLTNTLTHGLIIIDFIHVFLSVDENCNILIRVTTSGGVYESPSIAWQGYNGKIFAKSLGSSLTDCTLIWDCADYIKPIYIFGDSYMSLTSSSRWPTYIRTFGFDNWLVNGFPGQGSSSAFTMLTTILSHHKPKFIIWAMGMNDADTTVVNPGWKTAFDNLKSLCEVNAIELIACTIPSVPDRVHIYKNEVVRNSGLRYIDFNKAVGADISTSWFTGMLSVDNVHPSDSGARALAMRALMDVPELART